MDALKKIIRDVPDFPKEGIVFKDITTLLADAKSFQRVVDLMAHRYIDENIDLVLGVEARGFIMGSALAYKLGKGVILVRKPGKLPYKTFSTSYELEYGTDTVEVHVDAIVKGYRYLVIDDLLATGGTANASCELIEKCGGIVVGCLFVIELPALEGRKTLKNWVVSSIVQFEGE